MRAAYGFLCAASKMCTLQREIVQSVTLFQGHSQGRFRLVSDAGRGWGWPGREMGGFFRLISG